MKYSEVKERMHHTRYDNRNTDNIEYIYQNSAQFISGFDILEIPWFFSWYFPIFQIPWFF